MDITLFLSKANFDFREAAVPAASLNTPTHSIIIQMLVSSLEHMESRWTTALHG